MSSVAAILPESAALPVATDRTAASRSSGDLAAYLMAVESRLPGKQSGAFVDGPSSEVARAARAIAAARDGDIGTSRSLLDTVGYDLDEVSEPAGPSYWVAAERTPCDRCWGTYVVNRSATARDLFVEIPHPVHDRDTLELGLEAFRRTNATMLLLAGTHRYANGRPRESCAGIESDMARNDHSLFMAVHRLTGPRTVALQYHGFADRPGYPDVVLSNGSRTPGPDLRRLRTALEARGLDAGVFDGTRWQDLGATCNPQGEYSRERGTAFVHMEYRPAVRAQPDARRAAAAAVNDAFPGLPAHAY